MAVRNKQKVKATKTAFLGFNDGTVLMFKDEAHLKSLDFEVDKVKECISGKGETYLDLYWKHTEWPA